MAAYADRNPDRAERPWLAIAVETLWLLRVGGTPSGS